MNKKKIDLALVTLVYGNIEDLEEFIISANKIKCKKKIIVVNSYYDETTKADAERIALKYDCDFLNIENKGYGYGNNSGIEYANRNYEYDFICISNPDILISNIDYQTIKKYKKSVIGPSIITCTGKNQNPFYVRRKYFPKYENRFLQKKNKLGYYGIIGIYKLEKLILRVKLMLFKRNATKVYGLHGAFIIFSKYAIDKLMPVFDENIFLFCEEMVLAKKMKDASIKAIYRRDLRVIHKEDGSMGFLKGKMFEEEVKSNTYVYNTYFR